MSDTPSLSNPLPAGLRWYVRLSKVVLGLVLAFWALLLLASLALHFLIVPRIIDWRTEIEDAASKAWGVQVSIGQLSAISDGLVPSFEVTDFVLRNAQGDEVLHLPKLRASLSPASLLQLSLERIELDGPVLEVRRNAWPVSIWVRASLRLSQIGCCANLSCASCKVKCGGWMTGCNKPRCSGPM